MTSTLNRTLDQERKAKSYWREKYAVALGGLAFSIVLLAAIQLTGISSHLGHVTGRLCANPYGSLALYLLVFSVVYYAATLPFGFYEEFVLEHKFSLSNQSVAAWIKDELKKCALSLILFLALVETFYAIAWHTPHRWWIYVAAVWISLSVLFSKIFPILIIPLFYKYTPLSDYRLRNRMIELGKKFNIRVLDVSKIDFSKNTKKSNAAIVGLGSTKRVIFADNLINEFTPDEIEVVTAHEFAHHKLGHIWKLLLTASVTLALFFFILHKVLPGLAYTLGTDGIFDIALFPAAYLAFMLYSFIVMPVHNAISRKLERDADMMALQVTKMNGPFVSLMEKLASKNLSDTRPARLVEIIFYSHPPISKRIALAKLK